MGTLGSWIRPPSAVIVVFLSLMLGLARTAAAQEEPREAPPAVGEERFRVFVQAHVEIETIRDELQRELARWHEPDRKSEVRRDADERIARVLETHGIRRDAFDAFVRLISVDESAAQAFEEIAARLKAPSP